jgi:hypothetical protein
VPVDSVNKLLVCFYVSEDEEQHPDPIRLFANPVVLTFKLLKILRAEADGLASWKPVVVEAAQRCEVISERVLLC